MTAKTESDMPVDPALQALVQGENAHPMAVLGTQKRKKGEGYVVRAFLPYANKATVLPAEGEAVVAEKTHPDGLFEATFTADPGRCDVKWVSYSGTESVFTDPYTFPVMVADEDIYLFGEGTHERAYQVMGAHVRTVDDVTGVHFVVWAPNAVRVGVVGEFNQWDGRHHPMQRRDSSGVFELFIPGLDAGTLYKFEIKGANGHLSEKADPYAFATELRPRTASVVWEVEQYAWNDDAWMAKRRETDWLAEPISVYEVHLGSWKQVAGDVPRSLTYREAGVELVAYAVDMGYTHIELLPISEHPFDGSWGYQPAGYFAPTSRFGSPDDFKAFVDAAHAAGIGVIIDWVPAHFPKDAHGLGYFDGTHLYEHADPRKGEHMDWGTLIFNYGRSEVRSFLLCNAMFWAHEYHIDGLRVDAVASMLYLDYSRGDGQWIPNEFGGNENLEAVSFLKQFNESIHREYPGILTFAEESTSWPMVSRPVYLGGLGFGLKWNMGWMNDTLEYFEKEPIYRKFHHGEITFSMVYAFTENFILPLSHDEVVHGKGAILDKMPGDDWQRFANARLLYTYMYTHPGKKLNFMGNDVGQWSEWDHESSVDWHLLEYGPHRGVHDLFRDLNRLYRDTPAMHQLDFDGGGFEWIDLHDSQQSVLSYIRKAKDGSCAVVLLNFTPMSREGYRIGLPHGGSWQEAINSDSAHYGGSNLGNGGGLQAEELPWQGQPFSALISLPPLAGVVLIP